MSSLVDIERLKEAVEGISEQISTAINVGKVNRRVDEISKPNLLDNWYFKYLVNQRGVKGKVTTLGYFVDRWKLVNGSATITSDGLILDGVIQQILEIKAGQSTTATVMTTDGVLESGVEYDDDRKIFQIEAHGETLVAAKLEVGNHQSLYRVEDGNMLIIDEFNIADEIARCKRFYYVLSSNYLAAHSAGQNAIDVTIHSANMRAIPSVDITKYGVIYTPSSFINISGPTAEAYISNGSEIGMKIYSDTFKTLGSMVVNWREQIATLSAEL